MTARDFEEKRGFARLHMNARVQCERPARDEPAFYGVCLDLSASGLRMRTACFIEPGCALSLRITGDSPNLPPFCATGTVLRCHAVEQSQHAYLVSIRFDRVE